MLSISGRQEAPALSDRQAPPAVAAYVRRPSRDKARPVTRPPTMGLLAACPFREAAGPMLTHLRDIFTTFRIGLANVADCLRFVHDGSPPSSISNLFACPCGD